MSIYVNNILMVCNNFFVLSNKNAVLNLGIKLLKFLW